MKKNHCDSCEWLLSETTSKAVGLEHFCCLNPVREEVFGITEYFCGQWVPNIEQVEKKQREAAKAEADHHRRMMEAEMRAIAERDKYRMERDLGGITTKYAPPLPVPTKPPPFPVLKVEEEIEQKSLSLREKMKRRFT